MRVSVIIVACVTEGRYEGNWVSVIIVACVTIKTEGISVRLVVSVNEDK